MSRMFKKNPKCDACKWKRACRMTKTACAVFQDIDMRWPEKVYTLEPVKRKPLWRRVLLGEEP